MSRDVLMYVIDMREAGDRIVSYTSGMGAQALVADRKTFDAVARNLEILGEAAKHVPEDVRTQLPDVPWREIAGMRDKLAHDYFGIDEMVVCLVALDRVPPLRATLAAFLARSEATP